MFYKLRVILFVFLYRNNCFDIEIFIVVIVEYCVWFEFYSVCYNDIIWCGIDVQVFIWYFYGSYLVFVSCKLYKGNLIDMMSISLIFIKNWNYDLIVDDLGVKDFM